MKDNARDPSHPFLAAIQLAAETMVLANGGMTYRTAQAESNLLIASGARAQAQAESALSWLTSGDIPPEDLLESLAQQQVSEEADRRLEGLRQEWKDANARERFIVGTISQWRKAWTLLKPSRVFGPLFEVKPELLTADPALRRLVPHGVTYFRGLRITNDLRNPVALVPEQPELADKLKHTEGRSQLREALVEQALSWATSLPEGHPNRLASRPENIYRMGVLKASVIAAISAYKQDRLDALLPDSIRPREMKPKTRGPDPFQSYAKEAEALGVQVSAVFGLPEKKEAQEARNLFMAIGEAALPEWDVASIVDARRALREIAIAGKQAALLDQVQTAILWAREKRLPLGALTLSKACYSTGRLRVETDRLLKAFIEAHPGTQDARTLEGPAAPASMVRVRNLVRARVWSQLTQQPLGRSTVPEEVLRQTFAKVGPQQDLTRTRDQRPPQDEMTMH